MAKLCVDRVSCRWQGPPGGTQAGFGCSEPRDLDLAATVADLVWAQEARDNAIGTSLGCVPRLRCAATGVRDKSLTKTSRQMRPRRAEKPQKWTLWTPVNTSTLGGSG